MVSYCNRKIQLKYVLSGVCFVSVIFIIFQIKSIHELTNKAFICVPPIRGVHIKTTKFYLADKNNKFTCLVEKELIDFEKVNDDYCDCNDGTDEPSTDACPNGVFYCESDIYKRNVTPLPSSRVNDGICDCCDGSDEWGKTNFASSVPEHIQHLLDSYQSPCPNKC